MLVFHISIYVTDDISKMEDTEPMIPSDKVEVITSKII